MITIPHKSFAALTVRVVRFKFMVSTSFYQGLMADRFAHNTEPRPLN